MAGYTANLATEVPDFNRLPVSISIEAANNTGSAITANAGETIVLDFGVSNQDFSLVRGFFGDQSVDLFNEQLTFWPFCRKTWTTIK